MTFNELTYIYLLKRGKNLYNEFNYNTENAMTTNEATLFELLNANKKTEYGKIHNFETIKDINSFKEHIPLSTYDDLKPHIDRMVNGENNILVNDNIEYFSHTSGTSGYQKLIPNTKKSRMKASKYMGLLTQFIVFDYLKYKWTYKKGLMLTDMVSTGKSNSGKIISSATAGGMKKIKYIIPHIWTSPLEVMSIENRDTALYLHLLFALKYENLMYIGGTFISSILDLFRILENNYELLINDISKGTINPNLDIPKNIRKSLTKKLSPTPNRANSLNKEFLKGFNNIAKRIWPNLSVITTVTGGNFSIYDDKLKQYIGSIPIYSSAYGSSESPIGINPYLNKIAYVLLPDAAFFEFIKEDEILLKNPKTYNLNEVEINKNYEVVITSFNGLYRYRLGDIVRIIGYYNSSPELTFMYRKNQLLNMVSEKTTEEQVMVALQNLESKLKIQIIDYTTAPNNSITPGNYNFFLELNDLNISIKILENELDYQLRLNNKAYDRFRKKGALGKVKIILLKRGSFNYLKTILIKEGMSKNQLKIPRVINSNLLLTELFNKRA